MMKLPVFITSLLVVVTSASLHAGTVTDVQQVYRSQGAVPFSFNRGEQLWNNPQYQGRQCSDCHSTDLTQAGRHKRTRKPIEAMAPSVTPGRYADFKKVEKWFRRNCKWTWGRECTVQEKGDLLEYLKRL